MPHDNICFFERSELYTSSTTDLQPDVCPPFRPEFVWKQTVTSDDEEVTPSTLFCYVFFLSGENYIHRLWACYTTHHISRRLCFQTWTYYDYPNQYRMGILFVVIKRAILWQKLLTKSTEFRGYPYIKVIAGPGQFLARIISVAEIWAFVRE